MMRYTTYGKYTAELGDAVNLQALLDQLGDFLLQSGFAGGPEEWPWWAEPPQGGDRSMNSLKEAILEALLKSGQLTQDMVKYLRGEIDPESPAGRQLDQDLSRMLDQIVQRLMDEGYLKAKEPPRFPPATRRWSVPGAKPGRRRSRFSLI